MSEATKPILLHGGLIVLLFIAYFVMPEYHSGNMARIMVLAIFAMGFNITFGYTGLLSLGHALFFASGMYGLGLVMVHLSFTPAPAFLIGLIAAMIVSSVVAVLALRTSGVAFMIVTLMFAQAGYLTVLLFGELTRGDEGFVIKQAERVLFGIDLSNATNRYFAALALFSLTLLLTGWLVRTSFGRCLVAIRENEERAEMLGYNVWKHKFIAMVISGTISGASGAAYAVLFGSVGATFATVQYSIFPLLWVLLGGAGTTIGPFVGTVFMFYLIDWSSEITTAYLLIAGLVLVLLTLFAPQGIVGEIRRKAIIWLP